MTSHRFASLAVLLSALCIGAQAQKYTATLTAANQVPPLNASDLADVADLEATFTMEVMESGEIAWSLMAPGIQNLTMAHIHVGNASTSGAVVVQLVPVGMTGTDGMLTTPFSGNFSVDMEMFGADNFTGPYEGATIEDFMMAADAQGIYVNLHTVEYTGGAVRGQIMPTMMVGAPTPPPEMAPEMAPGMAPGSSSGWEAMLTASSQVPPLTDAEVGGAMATFTMKQEGEGYSYELMVEDVVNMTMAHIHMGDATASGGVVVVLVPVDGAMGANATLPVLEPPVSGTETYTGSFTGEDVMGMTAAEFQAMLSDAPETSFYVNIHTTAFPAGAIRSQIFFTGMGPTADGSPPTGPSNGAAAPAAPASLLLAVLGVLAAAML